MARLALALLLAAAAPAAAQCELTGVERVVAVGDVHGAHDRFQEILRAAALVDGRGRWSGGRAHLVQLGDVLDRGADSRQALDLLRRLAKEAARAGGAVHALLGNHEVMRLLGDLRYVAPGEYQAFATPGSESARERLLERVAPRDRERLRAETPLGLVEMSAAFSPDGEYGRWLRGRDAVVKIDAVVFAHGGISPAVAGLSCDEINERVRREIGGRLPQTRESPQSSLAASEDGPLWYRGLAREPEDAFAPELESILVKQRARAVVVAHTVAAAGRIQRRFGGRVFQIDTGMQPAYVPSGRASALEIRNGRLTAIYLDGRDPLGSLPDAPNRPAATSSPGT